MPKPSKIDLLVAEHVLELKQKESRWYAPESESEVTLRPFSEDISAAWELADRICEAGFRLQLDGSRIWQARFYKSAAHTLETRAYSATSRTPAEAICLAALAVKGVQPPR